MSPDKPHRSDLEADAGTQRVTPPEPGGDGVPGPDAGVSSATGDESASAGAGRDGDVGRPRQGALAVVRETAVLVVLAILLAVLFKTFLVQAFYIPSGSMEPTLNISDRVLVEKVSYRFGEVKDGDVIVFVHDLPGTEPESSNPVTRFFTSQQGRLYRNGRPVNEPYLAPGTTTENCTPTTVAAGKLFVMGDNRNNSEDSRTFGPIDRSTLVGRAFVRIWPLSHTGWLRRDQ